MFQAVSRSSICGSVGYIHIHGNNKETLKINKKKPPRMINTLYLLNTDFFLTKLLPSFFLEAKSPRAHPGLMPHPFTVMLLYRAH